MASITIDDAARFVCVLSFKLASGNISARAREIQHVVEQVARNRAGFVGSVVMINEEKPQLLVLSVWESRHAWGEAQYDDEIGKAVSDTVQTAESYELQIYETVTVVRAS